MGVSIREEQAQGIPLPDLNGRDSSSWWKMVVGISTHVHAFKFQS